MKKEDKERVEKLKKILWKKINTFSKKHTNHLFCYPDGVKTNSKGELRSSSYQQHIYLCHKVCRKPCDALKRRVYICREIGCSYYPICISKPRSKMISFCKSKNLFQERKDLIRLYNKFIYLMSVYRGLKTNPLQTLKYLDMKKKKKKKKKRKKKEEANNGQIQHKKSGKKSRSSKRRKK